jgi:hypothetical protein
LHDQALQGLAATYDPAQHLRAVKHGAVAVLYKLAHLGEVPQVVRQILTAERPVPAGKTRRAVHLAGIDGTYDDLIPDEQKSRPEAAADVGS